MSVSESDRDRAAQPTFPAGYPPRIVEPVDDALRPTVFGLGGLRHAWPRRPAVPAVLVVVDLVAVAVAGIVSGAPALTVCLFAVFLVLARTVSRSYRPRLRLSVLDELPRLTVSFVFVSAFSLLVSSVQDTPSIELFLGLGFVFDVLLAVLACAVIRHVRRRWDLGETTLLLGAGHIGQAVAQTMLDYPELGLRPVGFVDPNPLVGAEAPPVPVLENDLDRLTDVLREHEVQTVVLCFAQTRESVLVDSAIDADAFGCTVFSVPRLFELHHDGPNVERLRGYPLVRLNRDPTTRPSWLLKRVLDVLLALVALVALAPIASVCALAVLLESGRPVLFSQDRVGRDGRQFRIFKLRTMLPEDPEESRFTWSIAGDARVGAVGRVLRRSSLDELPQLWNVVTGRMSIVGPRPERPVFVELFSERYSRYWARHRVPTGLTGLAQVSGLRGDTSIEERARYDNYYISNWSLWLDAKVIASTFRELFRRGQH